MARDLLQRASGAAGPGRSIRTFASPFPLLHRSHHEKLICRDPSDGDVEWKYGIQTNQTDGELNWVSSVEAATRNSGFQREAHHQLAANVVIARAGAGHLALVFHLLPAARMCCAELLQQAMNAFSASGF